MNYDQLFDSLQDKIDGELRSDVLTKTIYATDASVYKKHPIGVVFPKHDKDIKVIIEFANTYKIPIIPRTAGTSLAGQCVGEGLVVDVSKHLTKIIHIDQENKKVTVQPGVIRDELNAALQGYGLFFGPNTSTANRCMIGGMVGNNSSGTTSIQYGVTRDKVVSLKTILSDGSEVIFESVSKDIFQKKRELNTLEGKIYNTIFNELSVKDNQNEIRTQFPKASIHRRNTGYAVDELLNSCVFDSKNEESFNMCKLLSGSEGTLAFSTEITLELDELPPEYRAMVVSHYSSLSDCLDDVTPVMQHNLFLCELMDKVILDCTKNNRTQLANRYFVEGDPQGLLMLEIRGANEKELKNNIDELLNKITSSGRSYAHPILYGNDIDKAIELRKAGLGLLGNIVGDKKAVACIEDTAVALEDLSDYISDFGKLMDSFQQKAVYYAHAGAGELHLRPILNLKSSIDVKLFREITTAVAKLVKKYKGSFSGEHGDGIVRAEFIPLMIGEKNYSLLRRIKYSFDPNGIFNPGKIVDAYKMDESLRFLPDRDEPVIDAFLDFSDTLGILRAIEQCNGSGDCRKTEQSAGTMCPSYHATKDEKDTTRARANMLREVLTNSELPNRFNNNELKEVLDLCIGCKACSSECPSNVDMNILKEEFLYQYQKENGGSFSDKLFGFSTKYNRMASGMPKLSNAFFNSKLTGRIIKSFSGIHHKRRLPNIYTFNRDKLYQNIENQNIDLVLFVDEFTQYLDGNIGYDTYDLLTRLGYKIHVFCGDSGRSLLSKGFLEEAKKQAEQNLEYLNVNGFGDIPMIGIEPSAILSFRDEYLRLVDDKEFAKRIADNCMLVEEFLAKEVERGRINTDRFTKEHQKIKIHTHCHQKALSNQKFTFDMLNLPKNYKVTIINSGCCGMAGSFGYEKEHYDVSMKIGETRLFPAIRKTDTDILIAANGISCRHQIYDGTGRTAKHPITILREALM